MRYFRATRCGAVEMRRGVAPHPLAIFANWRRGSVTGGIRRVARGVAEHLVGRGGRTRAERRHQRTHTRGVSRRARPTARPSRGERRARVRPDRDDRGGEWRTLDAAVNPPNPGESRRRRGAAGRSTEAGGTPAVRAAVRGTGGPGMSSSARRIEPRRRGRSRSSKFHRSTDRPRGGGRGGGRRRADGSRDGGIDSRREPERESARRSSASRDVTSTSATRTRSSPTPPNASPRRRQVSAPPTRDDVGILREALSWADDDEDDSALPSPMKDEKDAIDVDSKDAIDVDSADERVVRVG